MGKQSCKLTRLSNNCQPMAKCENRATCGRFKSKKWVRYSCVAPFEPSTSRKSADNNEVNASVHCSCVRIRCMVTACQNRAAFIAVAVLSVVVAGCVHTHSANRSEEPPTLPLQVSTGEPP